MDKQQARDIVRSTLEHPFERDKFIRLAMELLNNVDQSKAFQARGSLPEIFKEYIKHYERIGSYSDPDGKQIDLLVVELQKDSSIEKARTAQRNFVARYLKEGGNKEAGLVAFVTPNLEDWRFSFVKMDYRFENTPQGTIKVKEDFTPAKRFSFLVGANENSHTAQSRLLPLLQNDEVSPTIQDIENAFSVEVVTGEYFEEYRNLFLRLKESLDEVVIKDKGVRNDFIAKGVNTVDFAKKLLGQIVFLYFLQKKGWFGLKRGERWGFGSKRFLRELYERKHGDYKNFFNDILEPLFYEALRYPHDGDYYSRFECRIPFLNGGLFDPINNYDWWNTDISLPNDIFSNNYMTDEGDIGDGILDVFDRYNFTVKEDEPLEKEVAIDPELLGKAYEKFNAIRPDNYEEYKKALKSGQRGAENKFNKHYGVYYTPREVVHYMCQESLANFLATELAGKVSKEDIDILIKYGDTAIEHDAAYVEKKALNINYKGRYNKPKLPGVICTNAKLIDDSLATICVCDPAVGSGAFPVGMMTEIVRSRSVLSAYISDPTRSIYDLKRHCIHNSLYGVDIDPGAVEIAKLRLWLSLVVEEEDIKRIKPLPNLEYKIMQGNSLLEEYEGIQLFDEKLLVATNEKDVRIKDIKRRQGHLDKEMGEHHRMGTLTKQKKKALTDEYDCLEKLLKKLSSKATGVSHNIDWIQDVSERKQKAAKLKMLHHKFFDTFHKMEKDDIKREIEALEWELIEATLKEQGSIDALEKLVEFKRSNTKPFFLWQLNFSEVFQEKGGFDVVIMNPPYGRDFTSAEKQALKLKYSHIVERIRNSFLYFIGLGYNISKADGVICLILPNEFLFQIYMTKARRYYLTNAQYLFAINVGESVFDAIVPTCIIAIKKSTTHPHSYPVSVVDLRHSKYEELGERLNTGTFPITSSADIESSPNSIFMFDNKSTSLINKLTKVCQKFDEFCDDVANGISTSCDDVYIVDEQLVRKARLERSYLHQCIRGGQFNRYCCPATTGEYVLYVTGDYDARKCEHIHKYLTQHKSVLINKCVEKKQGKREWHVLFRARYKDLFRSPKILIRQTADQIVAALDYDVGYYCIDSVNVALIKENYRPNIKYFLGLLNSALLNFYYREISQEGGRVLAQVKPQRIRSLPIMIASETDQVKITNLVDRIIMAKDGEPAVDVTGLVHKLDEMVYALYGLTSEERDIVESMR